MAAVTKKSVRTRLSMPLVREEGKIASCHVGGGIEARSTVVCWS
jgi:hypothetical protein